MTRQNLPFVLSTSRLALGPLYVVAILRGGASVGDPLAWEPLAIAGIASLTDFVDGRLARRLGVSSPVGARLDVIADGVFLLCALGALAATGLVSWVLPVAAALSLGALARRWNRSPPGRTAIPAGSRGLADRVGHLAGILNYGAVLVASGVPLGLIDPGWLPLASAGVAGVNLAPIALRRIAG